MTAYETTAGLSPTSRYRIIPAALAFYAPGHIFPVEEGQRLRVAGDAGRQYRSDQGGGGRGRRPSGGGLSVVNFSGK